MAAQGIDELIAQITAIIYQNTVNDISGQELQDQLIDVVDSLNQGLYNNALPYNVGQATVIDNGGIQQLYICVVATTAGQSPITTPASWDLIPGSTGGVVLDDIVLSISALRALIGYSNDDQTLVNNNNGLYGFDSTDTQVDDGDLVVIPDDITHPAPGRWLKLKILVDTTTTGVLGDLITPVTTDLVDAINAIAVNGIEIVTNITALKAVPAARRENKTLIVKFYDEGDEGAVSGGVFKILFYRGPDLTNPEWEDLTNYQSLTPTITTGFTSTATNLEGIPSGTVVATEEKVEDLMTLLLNPYIASIIASFTLQDTPSVTEAEVGATILIDSVTIGVTNDSDSNPPATLNIAGTGYNVAGTVGVNNPPAPPLNVQQMTDASEVWTVTGTDGEANPINQLTVQIDWKFTHFVGANATVLTGSSTDGEVTIVIDALQISSLESGNEKEVILTGDFANVSNHTYIAYAAKYNDLSNVILNNGLDVLDAFVKVGDFNYTNSEGHVESYSVYKSNALGAFELNDQLNINNSDISGNVITTSDRVFTAILEHTTSITAALSDDDSYYLRFSTLNNKTISKVRIYVIGSTTNNIISIQIYDPGGALIAGGSGSVIPTVTAGLHFIDISLSDLVTFQGGGFYWVGIHQAIGGGASFMSAASQLSSLEWTKRVIDTSLEASVPTGVVWTNGRIVMEFL